jgi:hypothetical protein
MFKAIRLFQKPNWLKPRESKPPEPYSNGIPPLLTPEQQAKRDAFFKQQQQQQLEQQKRDYDRYQALEADLDKFRKSIHIKLGS